VLKLLLNAIHTNLFPMTFLQVKAGLMHVAGFITAQTLGKKQLVYA
jgi:hypothetical protein|tara:strand:- start:693 stop:830 length:138 start_codon:yes stop_codon:yes gene_type:complete